MEPTTPTSTAPSALPDPPLRLSTDIQGNILAGFNKDYQQFLFLRLPENDQTLARGWLEALIPGLATTVQVATFNDQFSAARRASGSDPESLQAVWVNLGLTQHGLLTFAPALAGDLEPFTAFVEGPAARTAQLGDEGASESSHWHFGRPDRPPIDAILTVAADDPEDLATELVKQRVLLARWGLSVLFEQPGETLPGDRHGHEHFGFKDGISQPGVRDFDRPNPDKPTEVDGKPGTDLIATGEFLLGYPRQTSQEGGPDEPPHPAPDWMHNGSFQVFRLLQQDVPSWWSQVLAQRASLPADDPLSTDALAAKLVGRWRSGTPLAQAPDQDTRSGRDRTLDNAFTFDDDLDGFKTPRFAHIRKMYPRLESGPEVFPERERHRILRRGIPFGPTFDPTDGRGHGIDTARGLCFNVFMASIEEGFEFLQQRWANNADFFRPGDGPDPVIGANPLSSPCTFHRDTLNDVSLSFQRFVATTGAVYAFAPSLSTLTQLAAGQLPPPPAPPPYSIGPGA
ncbi:MAG: Dyp-type peroxidase [Chloroflexota bacterium]